MLHFTITHTDLVLLSAICKYFSILESNIKIYGESFRVVIAGAEDLIKIINSLHANPVKFRGNR